QDASRARRAVPSREHRVRARARAACQLPQPRRLQPASPQCAFDARRRLRQRPMSAVELKRLMQKVAAGASLDEDEMAGALETMTSGAATPVQMAAFLVALRVRGETVPEITGACRLMRQRMMPVEAPPDAV